MDEVLQLSDCDLNEKIAVMCGLDAKMCPIHLSRSCCSRSLPKYCSDLNATHEVEQRLTLTQYRDYIEFLEDVSHCGMDSITTRSDRKKISAPARKRAEALALILETRENSSVLKRTKVR